MIKKLLFITPILFSLFSCQNMKQEKVLYTSFYPIYDFTTRIVGEHFEVVNLTPAGTEPHDFELTAKQVAALYDGSGLLLNGLGMEHWAESLPEELEKKTHIVSENISTITDRNNIADPHVWLSPRLAIEEMNNILSVVNTLDPDHKTDFEANFNKAKEDFLKLHEDIKTSVSTFTQKNIVVSHAAFGYFCNEYELNQIAVHGLEPEEEPSAKELEAIIEVVKEYNVNTIFTEEMASPEIAQKISEETGCKIEVLSPLEGLEEDQIGKEDYLSVMRENLSKLEKACK